jgi:cytochrome c553
LLALLAAFAASLSWASPDDLQLGKRIYREGILPSGELLTAQGQNGVLLRGAQSACVNCHRRSGLGSSEGGRMVRPIAGASLFHGPEAVGLRAPARGLSGRSLYTDELLVKAIRAGEDAGGRVLDSLMPRYALSDEDARLLGAYLKSLSSNPSPGVTKETIHFATVVTPGVKPEKRKAMLDVLQAYFRDKNAGTRHELRRASHAPWDMAREYQAYRKWVLHVWELEGPADDWPAQLAAHYRKQPVFALLSGIGTESWRPVHEFCQRQELPCVFPNTDLPVLSDADFYSVYFSRGMTLEAQALAKHLGEGTAPVVQVYRENEAGAVAAEALRHALRGRVRDRQLAAGERATVAFWSEMLRQAQSGALVLWLGDEDVRALGAAAAGASFFSGSIYFSSNLVALHPDQLASRLPGLRPQLYFVRPFDLAPALDRRLVRVRAWLRARNIASSEERLQADTYFAATVAGEALMHVVDNFSRDYFMERIENMLDNSFAATVYPRTSLGQGQRFASKGSYIVRVSADAVVHLEPVGGWIVP